MLEGALVPQRSSLIRDSGVAAFCNCSGDSDSDSDSDEMKQACDRDYAIAVASNNNPRECDVLLTNPAHHGAARSTGWPATNARAPACVEDKLGEARP